ncbi:hypothetical protein MK338_11840, partial [Streptococcus vestibularis]|nr:hypothetical protein [Streptococcus vestibularis]
TKFDVPF